MSTVAIFFKDLKLPSLPEAPNPYFIEIFKRVAVDLKKQLMALEMNKENRVSQFKFLAQTAEIAVNEKTLGVANIEPHGNGLCFQTDIAVSHLCLIKAFIETEKATLGHLKPLEDCAPAQMAVITCAQKIAPDFWQQFVQS